MKSLTPDQTETVTRLYEHDATFLIGQMGAGKTVCALTAAQELLAENAITRILVVAPLRVCNEVWSAEATQWEHLNVKVAVATGSPEQREKALRSDAQVVAINPDNLPQLCSSEFIKTFDGIIIDELSRFRVPGGVEFKALRKVIRQFKWRVGMTGTPVSENWEGLYAQTLLLDDGKRLGKNKTKFLLDYFYPTDFEQYNWVLRQASDIRIAAKLSDLVWTMPDYTGTLPELTVELHEVELPTVARAAYKHMAKEMVLGDVEAANTAVLSGKLQQIAAGFIYGENSTQALHRVKMHKVLDLAVANDQPVIVVYQFEWELEQLLKRFPDAPVAREEKTLKSTMVADWSAGKIPVLLMHPRSGGHGLNLQQGGHQIIWCGPQWSRDAFDQLNARLWRRGQEHPVTVHVVMARGTVDNLVWSRLGSKGLNHGEFLAHLEAASA